ncbi:MAG: PD-(D/E)XK nuclease family protein [Bacteroidales bacterium]|nr:PD-(D/E)XK nuclease family protein [Bacteroidales bacterium]
MQGIVLNRMYVGDYLASNLGHEVINLYQADNGGYYLYLNATGDFIKTHSGRVKYMLFVKYFAQGEVEVIGMAEGLRDIYNPELKTADIYEENRVLSEAQRVFIEQEDIRYGGAPLLDIFDSAEQQNVFITYKADTVSLPKPGVRIFIRFSAFDKDVELLHGKDDIVICLSGYQQAKASLKQYLYSEGTYPGDLSKEHVLEKKKDYERVLKNIILRKEYWTVSSNKVDPSRIRRQGSLRPISLFDICQIQNSENDFSNALSYFMQQPEYRGMWCDFFSRFNVNLDKDYQITREESAKIEDRSNDWNNKPGGGRIDLLIRDRKSMVIIENKIKSDINSVESDGEGLQLERYWNYAHWLSATRETARKTIRAFILMPKYGKPHIPASMKENYGVITYKDLYDFLKEHKTLFADDVNFCFFFDAMQRHTYDNVNDYLYHEMQDKFYRRIKTILNY